MLNSLNLMVMISWVVIAICMLIIFSKCKRYFTNRKKAMSYQENYQQDIKILKDKLAEVRLRNKGHSLDENISIIYNDESVSYSMGWEGIFE